jgi:acetoacetyl-CoA synthetase
MSAMASSNSQEADKEPIWVPSKTGVIPMNKYREHINSKFRQDLRNSQQLHRWSVTNPQQFWIDLYEYVGIIPALPAGTTKAYDESLPISSVPKFFENVQINYAENVLSNRDLNATALIGLREGQGLEGEKWTWRALTENVRVAASALKRSGVKEGDRIGALMSNSVWTIGLFLAAASMGVVFTSINPDLGDDVRVHLSIIVLLSNFSRAASHVFPR